MPSARRAARGLEHGVGLADARRRAEEDLETPARPRLGAARRLRSASGSGRWVVIRAADPPPRCGPRVAAMRPHAASPTKAMMSCLSSIARVQIRLGQEEVQAQRRDQRGGDGRPAAANLAHDQRQRDEGERQIGSRGHAAQRHQEHAEEHGGQRPGAPVEETLGISPGILLHHATARGQRRAPPAGRPKRSSRPRLRTSTLTRGSPRKPSVRPSTR